jgi:hypothetical protein
MKNLHHFLLCILIQFFLPSLIHAQEEVDSNQVKNYAFSFDESVEPFRTAVFKLSNSGDRYLRFIFWNQVWARALENNPGTLGVDGQPADWTTDLGVRRSRMLAYASVSPRFMFMFHIGINNQTFMNGGVPGGGDNGNAGVIPINPSLPGQVDLRSAKKPQVFIHDLWNEFKVSDELFIGMGLHFWNGVSRLSSGGTINLMTLDAPIFNWPNIEVTDQFARQFGFYAKGQIKNWDYRVAVNKPFSVGRGGTFDPVRQRPVAFNNQNGSWATQGYVAYQFWEKENTKLPFYTGTYLGHRKVFNIGGGWHHHPGATTSLNAAGEQQTHDMLQLGLDSYFDLPIKRGNKTAALTAYAVGYFYDFGPNYLRNVGIMNTGLGAGTTQNGPGNGQPMIGTGNIFHLQAGYLLPRQPHKHGFQPYGTLTFNDFDFYDQSTMQYGIGANYLISDHRAKVSLEYRRRPIFVDFVRTGGAGEIVLQTHILL